MKLARYVGGGRIAVVDEPAPACPPGGLFVKTLASGLCSGELMDWYMEKKVPHVLGHEVAGTIEASEDERFPIGHRVFVHHHAPCLNCGFCARGLYVHCSRWKRTRLLPGGMAEFFAVAPENLNDSFLVDDLRPIDAALIEPLGCVVKSLRAGGIDPLQGAPKDRKVVVIGLGVMGLMHMLALPDALGLDINPDRVQGAKDLGLEADLPERAAEADLVFVCPGNKAALDLAIRLIRPGGTLVLFAPMPPGSETPVDLHRLYFLDVALVSAYSCGPDDTRAACELLRAGTIRAEQVVSDFIEIGQLPEAYQKMKRGEILKPMVMF